MATTKFYRCELTRPGEICEVELPEGYRRVFRGAIKPGGLFLHFGLYRDGIVHWAEIERLPTLDEAKRNEPYSSAKWFGVLIRKDDGFVDPPCERCECRPRCGRNRFCEMCCYDVVMAGKQSV